MGSNKPRPENALITKAIADFPSMNDTELMQYLQSEHIEFACLSGDAIRGRIQRARAKPHNVKVVTVHMIATGEKWQGKLIGDNVIVK